MLIFRPQEVFNWLLSIDGRDFDVWDKGKITWHVQYRRTNGIEIPSDPITRDKNVGHRKRSNDKSATKQAAQTDEHMRRKRGLEIIKNDHSDPKNADSLMYPKESILESDDVFLEHHDPLSARDRDKYRLRAKLSIMKDDVQTVLPIAKVCLSNLFF